MATGSTISHVRIGAAHSGGAPFQQRHLCSAKAVNHNIRCKRPDSVVILRRDIAAELLVSTEGSEVQRGIEARSS